MTNRERNAAINRLLDGIDAEGRKKKYSWKRLDDLQLVEWRPDDQEEGLFHLAWCDECKCMTCHSRTGLCRKCQARKTGLGNPEIHQRTIRSQIEKGTFNMLQPEVQANKVSNSNIKYVETLHYCQKCKAITSHRKWPNGKFQCRKCNFANNGLKYGFCNVCSAETLHNGNICTNCVSYALPPRFESKYCEKCQKTTLHIGEKCFPCNGYRHAEGIKKRHCMACKMVTNHLGTRCLVCDPMHRIVWCEHCQKDTKHFNSRCLECQPIKSSGNPIFMQHCETHKMETPHRLRDGSPYCLACDGTHVWCEHCQVWETVNKNSIPFHWKFYKSVTLEWMSKNQDLVHELEDLIEGFDTLLNSASISGIYCWYVSGIPFYVGQSVDILSRSYDHMMHIVESPEWWADSLTLGLPLKIDVLQEENDANTLNRLELQWIEKLQPVSQKCDGTDGILPLLERKPLHTYEDPVHKG